MGYSEKAFAQGSQDKGKLVYIGNFKPEHSTENHLRISFENLGWEVYKIQEDELNGDSAEEILKEAEDAKFIFWTRTWHKFSKYLKPVFKKADIPIVSFHLDLYLDLKRGRLVAKDPFFFTDYVFSPDGGHPERFEELGVNHYFLSPGVLKDECGKGEYNSRFDYDIVFLGSYHYHKEWRARKILLEWCQKVYGDRFRLFGGSQVEANYGEVWGEDKNDLFASAKVILGDSLYSPNYWSDRVPETLGRGGFLLHPYVPGLEEEYEYFEHFVPYQHRDLERLKMVIDYYIEHDEAREEIAEQGMKWAIANHTYEHKAQYILSVLAFNNYEKRRNSLSSGGGGTFSNSVLDENFNQDRRYGREQTPPSL